MKGSSLSVNVIFHQIDVIAQRLLYTSSTCHTDCGFIRQIDVLSQVVLTSAYS